MHLKKYLAVSAFAGISVVTAFGASTIVIDDFDTPGFNINADNTDLGDIVPTGALPAPGDTSLVGTVTRNVALTKVGAGANVNNTLGYVALSNNFGTTSTLTVSYSFPANDISSGTAFSFQLIGTDAAVTYDLSVKDTANLISSVSGVSTPVVPGLFNVLFSSLTVPGGFDFTSVKEISFTIHAGDAVDVAIDAFGVDLPGVPEPSTYAAVGFMSLAAFGAYRRSRK